MSLTYIGDQITIYIGSIFLFTGLVGNGMNILIFLSVRTYRTTPCTFYFLIGSIRVIYEIDLTRNSINWCRAQKRFLLVFMVFIFLCFIIFHQSLINANLLTLPMPRISQYTLSFSFVSFHSVSIDYIWRSNVS